jgi:hypothetical protein
MAPLQGPPFSAWCGLAARMFRKLLIHVDLFESGRAAARFACVGGRSVSFDQTLTRNRSPSACESPWAAGGSISDGLNCTPPPVREKPVSHELTFPVSKTICGVRWAPAQAATAVPRTPVRTGRLAGIARLTLGHGAGDIRELALVIEQRAPWKVARRNHADLHRAHSTPGCQLLHPVTQG